MDLKDLLKSVPLFADLSPDQILWLSERCAEVSFQPGEIVFREGAPAEFFDILIEGAVDVTRGVDMTRAVDVTRRSAGQEGPVARFDEPGAACTLVALAAGHPFVGSGRANGSTRLLRFSAETFREMRGLCPSTVPKLMEALAAPVRAEEGRGPEKTAAETVRKSEEKYRTLFEEARFAIHLADETGRIVECNRHACDLMGYTREEMLQRRVQDVTGPDFRDSVSLRMSKILEEGMPPYESKNLRKDGASIDIEVSATPVDIEGRRYVMYFLRDITEKKRAEEELRASQERFRSITESATDAIVSADETGRIFLWNHGAEKIFGRREEEVLGQPLTLLIPERLREAYGKWMSRVRETGEPRLAGRTLESFGFRKDGSEFPMELSRAVWKRGEEMFFTWIIRDTSERKQAEEALRKSEEKHRTVFEQAGDAIVIADEAGRLVDCNRHACDLVDYRREELLGMKMRDFIPPGLREGLKKRLTVIARAGRGMTPYQVAEKLRRLGVLPTSQTLRAVTPIEVRNLLKLETCCF